MQRSVIYDAAVRIEYAGHLLVSYPCVYDMEQRRITTVHEQGRQPYGDLQAIQLMLWALGILRSVWRRPSYRRSQYLRRVLQGRQQRLFDGFA
jgi:hypothetical protein